MSLKEKLGEELYGQVMAKLGEGAKIADISDGSYIPKEKFDALNTEKKSLETQLTDRDDQLSALSKSAKDHEELSKQIKALQDQNKEDADRFEAEKAKLKFEHALETALRDNKAKNPKAVKALLDVESIKLDGDKLIGLEDQIKSLQESESYLFKIEDEKSLKGATPGGGMELPGGQVKNPFKEGPDFNLTEAAKLMDSNPELARKLQAEAQR